MNYKITQYGHETRFSSTNQPKNRGRKKNKFKHLREMYELGKEDVQGIVKYLLSLTLAEIEEIAQDPETPIIMVSFCSAIARSLKKDGTLNGVKYLLDYVVDPNDKGDKNKQPETHNVTETELEQALKRLDDEE